MGVGDCYFHFVPISKIPHQSHCGDQNSLLDNGSMSDARVYADFLWLEALFQRCLQKSQYDPDQKKWIPSLKTRLNAHSDAAFVRLLCLRSSLFRRLRDTGKLLPSDEHRDSGFDEACDFVAMRRTVGAPGAYEKPSRNWDFLFLLYQGLSDYTALAFRDDIRQLVLGWARDDHFNVRILGALWPASGPLGEENDLSRDVLPSSAAGVGTTCTSTFSLPLFRSLALDESVCVIVM